MNRKYILVILVIALAAAFVWFHPKPKPIVIGYAADLTGRMSELGVAGRNGVQLAVDQINERGGINGRPVKLLVEDDGNNPQQALEGDKRLVASGAKVIIGHMVSGVMSTVLPYINSQDALMISPTISGAEFNGVDDHFLRVIECNQSQGSMLAERAFRLGCRRVSSLYEYKNRIYAQGVCQSFEKRFTELGGQILLSKAYTADDKADFASVARDLLAPRPDGIISVTTGLDNALLCQQLSTQGANLPVFTGMWAMTNDMIRRGGKPVNNIYVAGTFDKFCQAPAYLAFRNAYLAKFRKEPDFSALYSYEAAIAAFEAMRRTSEQGAQSLKQEIVKINRFSGLQGDFAIDRYGDCKRPYSVYRVSDGEFHKEQ